jgi:hypothetical protein
MTGLSITGPCRYLGLPLGLRKPFTTQLQSAVGSTVNRLQPWCAKLMTYGGRTILVLTMLCAIPLQAMMFHTSRPRLSNRYWKFVEASCGVMWRRATDIPSWDQVVPPKANGSPGLPNLHLMNLALRCRCAWLQRVDQSKAWVEFDLHILRLSIEFFESATMHWQQVAHIVL